MSTATCGGHVIDPALNLKHQVPPEALLVAFELTADAPCWDPQGWAEHLCAVWVPFGEPAVMAGRPVLTGQSWTAPGALPCPGSAVGMSLWTGDPSTSSMEHRPAYNKPSRVL